MTIPHLLNHIGRLGVEPREPIFRSPLCFVDVETVVDRQGEHRIVEICVVSCAPDRDPITIDRLVDPMLGAWGADAAAWQRAPHGITPEMLEGAPYWTSVMPYVAELVAGSIVCAHNASYERRVLGRAFGRYGRPWSHPHLCTMRLARQLYPEQSGTRGGSGYSLEALAARFEIDNPAPHRAAADTMCMVGVLGTMLCENYGRAELGRTVRQSIDRPVRQALVTRR